MKKLYTLILIGIAMALVLSGCGATAEPEVVEVQVTAAPVEINEAVQPSEGVNAQMGAGKWIVFVTNLGSHPWWTPILKGMQEAAAETGVEFTITGPSGYDTAAQVTALEQVISQDPDGIIVGVLEAPAVTASTEKAREAGIPIIWLATGGEPSAAVEQLFPNEDEIGAGYAHKIAELLDGKGTVGLSMQIGNSAIRWRNDRFMETLEEFYPDIELVGEYPMGGADEDAAKATAAFLQANPELDGLVVTSGNGAGVLTALRETGQEERAKSGELAVVASDVTTEEILDAVNDGIFATVLQQNLYAEGYLAVYDMLLMNINPNPAIKNLQDQGVLTNPKWVNVGYVWVTKDNAEAVRDMIK